MLLLKRAFLTIAAIAASMVLITGCKSTPNKPAEPTAPTAPAAPAPAPPAAQTNQVQLPPDTTIESVRRKLAYDLYYVRQVSFWLDVRILFCTAFKVIGVPFHLLRDLFRMPSRFEVERAYESLGEPTEIAAQVQLA